MVFEEVGPGRVLTDLIARIQAEAVPLIVEDDIEEPDIPVSKEMVPPNALPAEANKPLPGGFAEIVPSSLGSAEFRKDYNLKYAYVTGGMYRGIASKELVVKMGKAGMMGFFGTGGLKMPQIEDAIHFIQNELTGEKLTE
ncbi:hypothetical protein LJK88_25065 [Paenibacillus sp. P26]|nr:hypothetical protein LJK88_25065 [Paenibacillus sp. P26]UUZ95281.1 hypothetical protein LJK87_12875 [Paenibacillus sp. P25]